jgi:hypothetical protein
VVGLGPPDIGYKGMAFPNRLGWTYSIPYLPWLTQWYFQRDTWAQLHLDDQERVKLIKKQFLDSKPSQRDQDEWERGDVAFRWAASAKEVLRQGWGGLLQDGRLSSTSFGFRVQDIPPEIPLNLWYGRKDTNVPVRL